jgi:Holliday junction resolvase RusA-like endonuclease
MSAALPYTFAFVLERSQVMSANDREQHHARARRTRYLRALGLARGVDVVKSDGGTLPLLHGPVRVSVRVAWPDRRRRDTPNAYPTVKALLDGLVDAGLLADDRDGVIVDTSMQPILERTSPAGLVELYLTLARLE